MPGRRCNFTLLCCYHQHYSLCPWGTLSYWGGKQGEGIALNEVNLQKFIANISTVSLNNNTSAFTQISILCLPEIFPSHYNSIASYGFSMGLCNFFFFTRKVKPPNSDTVLDMCLRMPWIEIVSDILKRYIRSYNLIDVLGWKEF